MSNNRIHCLGLSSTRSHICDDMAENVALLRRLAGDPLLKHSATKSHGDTISTYLCNTEDNIYGRNKRV